MTRRLFLLSAAAIPKGNPLQWIGFHLNDGTVICKWRDPEVAVSMGSLLKPFLALAYAATHRSYPTVYCAGARSGCWYPPGHGKQAFPDALANSCNTYFLRLTSLLDRAALETICLNYGLASPARSLTAEQLIGLGSGWRQSPLAAARAFGNLAANRGEQKVDGVLAGMALCARSGTARRVNLQCYAKTGTALCSHQPRGSGDGYALAFYPLDEPRQLLFAQHHNQTGASTAADLRALSLQIPEA